MVDSSETVSIIASWCWVPLSDWQPNQIYAAMFLPPEALSGEDLPDWVLLERCHAFAEWSFRYSIRSDVAQTL